MSADVDPTAPPSGTGCVECDATGGWWVHLRRCAACGHIGCCDDSLERHASAHWRESGHPIIRSFEPGEDWFWNYRTNEYYDGPELAAPDCRPTDETVPGPRGRVPGDWADQLRRRSS
jgi:Zn-finger in ubiquitin-hydrolases and other protein